VLRLYNCTEIGDHWYLTYDVRLRCYTAEWALYAAIGVPVVIMYVFGIPAYFGTILWKARNDGVRAAWDHISKKRSRIMTALQEAKEDARSVRPACACAAGVDCGAATDAVSPRSTASTGPRR